MRKVCEGIAQMCVIASEVESETHDPGLRKNYKVGAVFKLLSKKKSLHFPSHARLTKQENTQDPAIWKLVTAAPSQQDIGRVSKIHTRCGTGLHEFHPFTDWPSSAETGRQQLAVNLNAVRGDHQWLWNRFWQHAIMLRHNLFLVDLADDTQASMPFVIKQNGLVQGGLHIEFDADYLADFSGRVVWSDLPSAAADARQILVTRLRHAAALALALVEASASGIGFVAPAVAHAPAALSKEQSTALAAYDKALDDFKAILATRRAQITMGQRLPNLPGQALYLARTKVMSTYKDLTDALPSRIGRPNKFGVPPAYFDADIEPLIEEYAALFRIMQAPPAYAQDSRRPSRTSSTSARRSRAPRASTPQPPTRRAASASGFSLPRPTATRTSAMRAPTTTRAACRRACRRIAGAAGSGRRSSRGSRRSIPRWPPATTRRRRASASATSGSITGPRCATA